MADLLYYWLDAAYKRVHAAAAASGASDGSGSSIPPPPPPLSAATDLGQPLLPSPLLDAKRVATMQASAKNARCYSMLENGAKGGHFSLVYQRLQALPWHTAHCPRDVGNAVPLTSLSSSCTNIDARVQCRGVGPDGARSSVSRANVWFFCFNAFRRDGSLGKKSPGVLAVAPGATIDLPVNTILGQGKEEEDESVRVRVKLTFLTSYESMGRLSLTCVGGCKCERQILDGHRTYTVERNISVYEDYEFEAVGASSECIFRGRILQDTSSGGHKFKMRFLTVTAPGTYATLPPPPPPRPAHLALGASSSRKGGGSKHRKSSKPEAAKPPQEVEAMP